MTNSSRFSQVSDELLSAYLDQAVTAEEKALVEATIKVDAEVAWRLETLRQTVALLKTLPLVALPRSFVLTQSQLTETTETELSIIPPAPAQRRSSSYAQAKVNGWSRFWEAWYTFWQMGNPLLRNAAAVSFAILLVLLVGDQVQPPAGGVTSISNRAAESAPQANIRTDNGQPASLNLPAQQQAAPTPTSETLSVAQAAEQPTALNNEATILQAQAAPPATQIQGTQPELGGDTARSMADATAVSVPPGEDNTVDLAPDAPGTNQAERTVSGAGGSNNATESPNAAFNASPVTPALKTAPGQTQATTSTEISAAAVSPLALPTETQLSYYASSAANSLGTITETAALTAEIMTPIVVDATPTASPTPTTMVGLATKPASSGVAITPTMSSPAPTMTPTSTPPPSAPTPVSAIPASEQSQPTGQTFSPAGEKNKQTWFLAQLTSAFLTLVLGSLWWRSRR